MAMMKGTTETPRSPERNRPPEPGMARTPTVRGFERLSDKTQTPPKYHCGVCKTQVPLEEIKVHWPDICGPICCREEMKPWTSVGWWGAGDQQEPEPGNLLAQVILRGPGSGYQGDADLHRIRGFRGVPIYACNWCGEEFTASEAQQHRPDKFGPVCKRTPVWEQNGTWDSRLLDRPESLARDTPPGYGSWESYEIDRLGTKEEIAAEILAAEQAQYIEQNEEPQTPNTSGT